MPTPKLPVQFPLPAAGEQPMTYPELMDKLKCVCAGGVQITAGPVPSATINIGDIIADHAKALNIFTSIYGMITVILKMISCIIEVLCALVNPFALIPALIKLFASCLPDFILIIPQFAVPAKIICILKIILAIVQYIITVIVPIILDIIRNVQNLINAFSSGNTDAQAAIAFKIVALIKELFNIVGILGVIKPIMLMIEALMKLGVNIPCSGSGDCCTDANCPPFIRDAYDSNPVQSGSDGIFQVIYQDNPYTYRLRYGSAVNRSNFLQIADFFPAVDYSKIDSIEKVPYILIDRGSSSTNTGNSYAATSVDGDGFLNLTEIVVSMNTDGYLSTVNPAGYPFADPFIRFATRTSIFTSADTNKYLEIEDTRVGAETNGGFWQIVTYSDAHNVTIRKEAIDGTWAGDNSAINPTPFINWRLKSPPAVGINRNYTFEINHNELIHYSMISLGCHPAIVTARAAALATVPVLPDPLYNPPYLPDFTAMYLDAYNCITAVAPMNVDSDYVLTNYAAIAQNAANASTCLDGVLIPFQTSMTDFVKQIYPRTFDPIRSAAYFFIEPIMQRVGSSVRISFSPYDIYGSLMGLALPPGILAVSFNTTVGTVGPITEVMDENGNSTGLFLADLTSPVAAVADVTAQVATQFAATVVGTTLTPKVIQVRFVAAAVVGQRDEASTEPLGKNSGA